MQRMAYNSFPLWIGGQCSNMIWCSGIGQLGCLWSKTDTWSQKLWADSARWQFRFFQAKYSQHSPSKDASFSSSAVSAPDSDDTFGYFREFTSRTLWFLLQGCRGDGDAREAGHWWLVGFDEKWLAEWLAKTIDFSLDFSLTSHWLLIDFMHKYRWQHGWQDESAVLRFGFWMLQSLPKVWQPTGLPPGYSPQMWFGYARIPPKQLCLLGTAILSFKRGQPR
jgi:hypothetical protein